MGRFYSHEERSAMARHNRPGAARRWPAGVLEDCLRAEAERPGWFVSWLPENPTKGFERDAMFTAQREDTYDQRVSGATVEELLDAIDAAPQRDWRLQSLVRPPD
jgi:hypothetical protein